MSSELILLFLFAFVEKDSDNFDHIASPLVRTTFFSSGGHKFESPESLLLLKAKGSCGQVFLHCFNDVF